MSANNIRHGGRFRHAALEREKAWHIFLKERSVFCATSLGWSEGACRRAESSMQHKRSPLDERIWMVRLSQRCDCSPTIFEIRSSK
jgi:hypothetical protein